MKACFPLTLAIVAEASWGIELYHDLEEDASSFLAVVNPSKATSVSETAEPLRVALTRTYGGNSSNWRNSAYGGR